MLSRFYHSLINTFNQWLDMLYSINQSAPVPVKIKSNRIDSQSELRNRAYRKQTQKYYR